VEARPEARRPHAVLPSVADLEFGPAAT